MSCDLDIGSIILLICPYLGLSAQWNLMVQEEEHENQEEKADSSPCLEIPEFLGSNNSQPETPNSSEEQVEEKTPETPEVKISQEEEQEDQQEKADSSPCLEIPEFLGSNNSQPETPNSSEEQVEEKTPETPEVKISQEIPEFLGSNNSQPETPNSSEEQVEEKTPETPEVKISQAIQHPLEKKYPKPRTYIQALELIGEDNYGVIYNGWHRKQQKDVSITIIRDPEKQKEILKKIDFIERTSGHGKIVGFHGAYYLPASKKMPHYEGLWVSTELYTGSSLKELINGQKKKSLPENTIAYICKEVLQGLSHLHKNKVIRHDLRPGNIMVASSGDIKIIDFTSATMGLRSHATSGAIPYMAPEVMANIGNNTVDYTTKADVWSLGISALEMAEGYYPFSRFPENKLMKRIMHGPAPTLLWDTWSDVFHFFISECLQKNPARRPSAEQLLSHPFISNISNERGVKKLIKRHLQKCKGTAHSHYNSLN
ncbi:traf2 and NCK-interacting protein kinase [Xenopus laevis]|uniref:Traf2 and NCK-interacting protein kinase n=1 Tax=Xenopus laevis TaxID=8355 RepID=A0A8J0V5I8_XENLA|nr:traf2 and NCK-interacting protein kinase [Xenopus laevis]